MQRSESEKELFIALQKSLQEKMQEYEGSDLDIISKLLWLKLILELEDAKGTFGEKLGNFSNEKR